MRVAGVAGIVESVFSLSVFEEFFGSSCLHNFSKM